MFFCYQAPTSVGATVVHLVSTYLTRGIEEPKHLEVRRLGGAIYLPYLILHNTAWSAQKGM